MPTYISLCRWTQQGAQKIKESPSRLDSAKRMCESFGVRVRDFYMTTGQYDIVIITEATDDAAIAKAMLTIASMGSVKTETMRAFNEDEYGKVMAGLN
jgi:uncharacterized protein with GYD domain